MTIKEMAEMTGLTTETVRVKAKELYPLKFEARKKTAFAKDESIHIVGELRKKGFMSIAENLPENLPVDRLDRLENMVENLIKITTALITNQNNSQKQITFIQDYYSIKGYCSLKKIVITHSEAIGKGKESRALSAELKKDIRKVPDEQYGEVNSYHIDVLNKVFEL